MFKPLEKQIKYSFQNRELLKQALVHSSYAYEHKLETYENNERLEFLGDAVLEIVISDCLFHKYPQMPEGDLTKLRASVVCEPTLAQNARDLSLGEFLMFGKGEEQTGGKDRDSILADAFESVIGAIYLDGGLEAAKKFILDTLTDDILKMKDSNTLIDYKTFLQEYYQRTSKVPLKYTIIDATGPDHDKSFTAMLTHGEEALGQGMGKTKKEAEQNAALDALHKNNIEITH